MFCERCGTQLADDEKSCQNCGWSNSEDISIIDEDYNDFRETAPIQENVADEAKNIGQKRISTVLGIVAVVIAIIIGGIVIGVKQYDAYKLEQYHASDEYKILTAEETMLKGNYEEALTNLQSVDTESANAMKQYVAVLKARDEFVDTFDETKIVGPNANNMMYSKMESLRTELREFEEGGRSDFLSAKLSDQYHYYKDKLAAIDEAFDNSNFYDDVYSAQLVLLNDINRNQGQTFSLQEIQTVANSSEVALNRLEDFYSKYASGLGGQETIVNSGATELFFELYDDLTECVRYEITSEKNLVEKSAEEFGMDDELSLKTPDESVSNYYIHLKLEYIHDYDDMYTNASLLVHTGKAEAFAYYIVAQDSEFYADKVHLSKEF